MLLLSSLQGGSALGTRSCAFFYGGAAPAGPVLVSFVRVAEIGLV